MRVKGSAFGGLQVRGVEETLTTSVTSGGKAGVWRKEEERKGMREEKSSNVVIARSSFPFLFFSRWTKHFARQAIPRSKDPNNPNLFLDYSSIPSLLIERYIQNILFFYQLLRLEIVRFSSTSLLHDSKNIRGEIVRAICSIVNREISGIINNHDSGKI